jgi:hypothetical protein
VYSRFTPLACFLARPAPPGRSSRPEPTGSYSPPSDAKIPERQRFAVLGVRSLAPAAVALAALAVACGHVALPPPPAVQTFEGQQCVQTCQMAHSLCTAAGTGNSVAPAAATTEGVLIGVLAAGMASHRTEQTCAEQLAGCYSTCAAAAHGGMAACGPRCADGSPAVWRGISTVTGAPNVYTNLVVSMCATPAGTVDGNWSCSAGSVACAVPGGTFSGGVAAGVLNAHSTVPGSPDVACDFIYGMLAGSVLRGIYRCTTPRGLLTGEWGIVPCPQ